MAFPTSSCTIFRTTVSKLFCLGMAASLPQTRILNGRRESKGRQRGDCAARRSALYRASRNEKVQARARLSEARLMPQFLATNSPVSLLTWIAPCAASSSSSTARSR